MGGTSTPTSPVSAAKEATSEEKDCVDDLGADCADDLYAQPRPIILPKKHRIRSLNNRLKARQISEERLIRLSAELGQLADEIRYLNPLMAEVLDDAWEATEDAIDILSNESFW